MFITDDEIVVVNGSGRGSQIETFKNYHDLVVNPLYRLSVNEMREIADTIIPEIIKEVLNEL